MIKAFICRSETCSPAWQGWQVISQCRARCPHLKASLLQVVQASTYACAQQLMHVLISPLICPIYHTVRQVSTAARLRTGLCTCSAGQGFGSSEKAVTGTVQRPWGLDLMAHDIFFIFFLFGRTCSDPAVTFLTRSWWKGSQDLMEPYLPGISWRLSLGGQQIRCNSCPMTFGSPMISMHATDTSVVSLIFRLMRKVAVYTAPLSLACHASDHLL